MLSAYERRVISELEQQLAADSAIRRERRMARLRTAEMVLSAALLVATAVAGMYLLLPRAVAVIGAACLGLLVGRQLGRSRASRLTARVSRMVHRFRHHA
jgi:hypothetical protein